MPNTSEGFYYPDANTNIAPLETVLANMAASSNSVAQQTPRVFANYAAMVAGIPSPVGGRLAITTQGSGILWQYDGTAAKWVVQNRPAFSDVTARDAAIPFPTVGITAVIGTGAGYAEYLWTGAAWARSGVGTWQSFTPAWSNLTLGNGTSTGRYVRIGNTVHAYYSLTFGSTTVVTGGLYVALPIAALNPGCGSGTLFDSSAPANAIVTCAGGDWLVTAGGRVNATVPWTWAVNDYIRLTVTYEAA